jgi:hypothetical protein
VKDSQFHLLLIEILKVGLIERGDMFFGCVTSDEFPDINSGQVCARLDSVCK